MLGGFSLLEIYFQEKRISIHESCPLTEQERADCLETILFRDVLFSFTHRTVLHVLRDAVEGLGYIFMRAYQIIIITESKLKQH